MMELLVANVCLFVDHTTPRLNRDPELRSPDASMLYNAELRYPGSYDKKLLSSLLDNVGTVSLEF